MGKRMSQLYKHLHSNKTKKPGSGIGAAPGCLKGVLTISAKNGINYLFLSGSLR
ncbi:hypothetical protein [Domibacillus tundrae]|uniref:hypothetical protein n=1 Tax=Domibacillus tundrae TaxID=1587527 RepID=UPI00339078C7